MLNTFCSNSGEGEKSVQIRQVEVRMSGEGEKKKGSESESGKRKVMVLEVAGRKPKSEGGVVGAGNVDGLKEYFLKDVVLTEKPNQQTVNGIEHIAEVQPSNKRMLHCRGLLMVQPSTTCGGCRVSSSGCDTNEE